MKKIIIDTNGFLRFLLNDVSTQRKAFEKVLRKAKQNKIIILVPQIVIFELDFILEKYYQFKKEEIIDKLKSILSTHYLQIQDGDCFRTAIELYSQKNISFVDCFLLSKTKIEKAELFTFDKKLGKFI